MKRDDLVAYLNDFLQVSAIEDVSTNGLQVEGAGDVRRVALAVDAGLAAFRAAEEAGAQMLIVHHGLFWGKPVMITGIHRQRLGRLLSADLSLYAVHLPLDFHDEVGNNVTLAYWLGLGGLEPFGDYKGHPAGVVGRLAEALSVEEFVQRVEETLAEPVIKVWPFGPSAVQRVGVCSGAAGSSVHQAAEASVDLYLTGEMDHGIFHQSQELGLNVVYGGHYATETAGLKALGEHLESHLPLKTVFLDLPTGA